jgi:glycosyltransferase involved in cell wall biosynthesis
MKEVIYIANIKLPTDRAHGGQIVNTCHSLADKGAKVELIINNKSEMPSSDIFNYYNLSDNFFIRKIKTIDLYHPYYVGFLLQRLVFLFNLFQYIHKNKGGQVNIYCRDEFILLFLSFKYKNIFWEVHEPKTNIFAKLLMSRIKGIVYVSGGLETFHNKTFISNAKTRVIRNGFIKSSDNKDHSTLPDDYLISKDSKIITYIGSIGIYGWKGVDIFLDASLKVPEHAFLVVGGKEQEIKKIREKYTNKNIILTGHKKPSEVHDFQLVSDILILPNKAGDVLSEVYTSPIKLFEYISTGRPVIISDLPSAREILDDSMCTFFKPNDSNDLADKIKYVLNNYDACKKKAEKALLESEKYSYEKRAESIMDFIDSVN